MGKATKLSKEKKGVKKAVPKRKSAARKALTVKNLGDIFLEKDGGLKINGQPITYVGAGFNPDSKRGVVTVYYSGGKKDVPNLSGGDLAAILGVLSLGNITYDGQYFLGVK